MATAIPRIPSTSAKVKIAARLRPILSGEPPDTAVRVVRAEPDSSANTSAGSASASSSSSFIAVANPRDATQVFRFPFTSCYDADSTQAELFEADVRPLIDVARQGVTVTIFAYGVTSSGKTHTMQGTPADPGVIPRVVEALFAPSPSPSCSSHEDEQTSVSVSYIEIYKDDVYDLLVARENAPKLQVRENDAGAVFVAGRAAVRVDGVRAFGEVYSTATARRSVGATLLNRASSRSHAVLTLDLRVVGGGTVREGKINLVDLAGSENNRLTGNDPARMAESAAINKSLSVLGQVVHAINVGAPRIPYRNAKLTRILQDALGGSAVGLLICNLAPGAKFRQDTLNTLNFAVRTKNIENKPVVNERGTPLELRPAPAPLPMPKLDLAHPPAPALAPAPGLAPKPRAGGSGRPSLVPRPASRVSSYGVGALAVYKDKEKERERERERAPPGLSEAEIDARISRAVEAEVARRLAEREVEMGAGAGSSRHKHKVSSRGSSSSPRKEKERERDDKEKEKSKLPPGLSPLLKRHKDLDDELQARLQELERKFEKGNKEVATGLADVLSPVSRKKTGRAYVALARAHSDKGDLQTALELYRRAETYVPDNVKLKERIIEIEWAVKHGRPFKPSPKPKAKKGKGAKGKGKKGEQEEGEAREMDVDGDTSLTGRAAFGSGSGSGSGSGFGSELTNTGSKRSLVLEAETPAKRAKRAVVVIESDEEDVFVPDAAPRKSRRRIGHAGAAGVA
ncbi:P-loop containing nucleoside triphosphate hydrolase protein [Mycena epipterygia]|nr:P-loop containing nucleoside triphosphate hydrolase protein [Mycena epipterygia]